ncbi:MAG: rhodanese-like domain-containing protein [Thermoanaerobaculales bacterium]
MKQKSLHLFVVIFFLLTLASSMVQSTEFPHRVDYPGVTPIDTLELATKLDADEVVLVDVRSKIEFIVIHAVDAINIRLSSPQFVEKVASLFQDNPGKEVVFYCNGVTCLKSYEAANTITKAGYKNCYAYDAGIMEWARVFPERTLLLKEIIKDPEKQLISKSEFKKKCLPFSEFKSKATGPNTIVVDVRDRIQSSGSLPGLEDASVIPMDSFISTFVVRMEHKDKTLLIFDQVGKQVRWLEYYLAANGYQNYFFLKGGATDVLKNQRYKE